MEKKSEYFVKNPKLIFKHLNKLVKQNSLISAHFGDNNESFLTTILDLDLKKHQIKLDYGPKEYLNKLLLASNNVEFRTELNGIKVAFSGQKISRTKSNGQIVFVMPIPAILFWMQRRKFYRVKVPLSHNSYCKISFKDEKEETPQMVKFKLMDLSISGIAFFSDQKEFSDMLNLGNTIEHCELCLGNSSPINLSLTVKDKINLLPDRPDKGQRIGCSFTQITPASESIIQRYMQEIERELRNIRQ